MPKTTVTNSSSGVTHNSSTFNSALQGNKSKYLSAKVKKNGNMEVWIRIIANLVVVVAFFASLSSMFIIIELGAFSWFVLLPIHQDDSWRLLDQSCILTSSGFQLNSCTPDLDNVVTTNAAWAATGKQLASIMNVSTFAKVTVCVIGCNATARQTQLQLLVGSAIFPTCSPARGGQLIRGMVMIEAANVGPVYPSGAYLLTVFDDTTMHQVRPHINSDKSEVPVIADVVRVLIGTDGSSLLYPGGVNHVIQSHPLGSRYQVEMSCVSQMVDIGGSTVGRLGWSIGEISKRAIAPALSCGHNVSQTDELVYLHIVLVLITIAGLGGDMLMTFEGLRGVLLHKPVLTYDILTGVERRIGLLFIGAVSAFPALIFFDVGRINVDDQNNTWFWLLSITSLGIFISWFALLCILAIQFIPSPKAVRHKLVPWTPAIFIYSGIPAIAISVYGSYDSLHEEFHAAIPTLTMNISGKVCACGAFSSNSILPATTPTAINITIAVLVCFALSIIYAMFKQYYFRETFLLDVSWTKDNAFLKHSGMPYWFTGLPLDKHDTIRIGNRLFANQVCKFEWD